MGTPHTCDEGIERYSTRIELFYFDGDVRRIAQWVLAFKGANPQRVLTEIIIEIKQFNAGRIASHASIESI